MELNTYGDLKKAIKAISSKQKGEKIGNLAIDTITGFIPGADVAKTTFDFVRAAFSKPDTKKTKTWLDKLDIDDNMSSIIDDTVENGFLQMMAKTIDTEQDTKPLESDFNMNAKMVNYLKQKYGGRTITGIQESNIYKQNKKMKNEALKKLIKEEIKNILELDQPQPSTSPKNSVEVQKLIGYLQGTGKSALQQINKPTELKQILDTIWGGMNSTMQKNPMAISVKKVADMKL